jgi:hypothetical protein
MDPAGRRRLVQVHGEERRTDVRVARVGCKRLLGIHAEDAGSKRREPGHRGVEDEEVNLGDRHAGSASGTCAARPYVPLGGLADELSRRG